MSVTQPDIASDPEVKALAAQTESLLAVGTNYRVTSAADYEVAGLELKRVKDAQKKLDDLRKSMTRPIDAAKKAIMDFFRGPEQKLATAESGIKRAMIGYSEEQDRIRREAQRKADEAARKEQEKLQQQAAKAIASGKVEKAEQLEQRAATVVAPIVQREAPRVSGIVTKEVWKFEVTDPAAVPREYLSVDEKKIGGVVRSLKGDTNIAGVRVWSEKSIAAGAV